MNDQQPQTASNDAPSVMDQGAKPSWLEKQVQQSKETGAKIVQSATLGFGADVAGKVFGKDTEVAMRKLANQYDEKHPLAGIAIDVATMGAAAMVPGAGEAYDAAKATSVGARIAKASQTMAGRTAVGSAVGGLAGVGAGGNADQRIKHGMEGALTGGAVSLGLGAAGDFLLKPMFARFGAAGLSQAKSAADEIKSTLTKEGKSVDDLNKFMKENPGSRIADFSPKVADLVSKAVDKSNDTARQLQANIRADQAAQQARIARQAQPLLSLKEDMHETADKLAQDRDVLYKIAYKKEVPVTPELQKVLDSPTVKPLYDQTMAEFKEGKAVAKPGSKFEDVPDTKEGKIQNYVLDELQRKLTDPKIEATGSGHRETIETIQKQLNSAGTTSLEKAQLRAAEVGGIDRAQEWGNGFAKGLKTSDLSTFRQMSKFDKQYARLGVANGLEDLVRAGRLSDKQFTHIADSLKDPMMVEVLGKKNAQDAAKIFKSEAARLRTNTAMASGSSNRTMLNSLIEENSASHVANVATKGVGGSALRMIQRLGMSEPQAKNIIDIATKPGGIDRLRKSGLDKNMLDKLQSMIKVKGAMSGALSEVGREQDLSQ